MKKEVKTVKCKDCLAEIDAKAKKCSKCGTDQRNWLNKHPVAGCFSIIVIAFILLMIINPASKVEDNTSRNTVSNSTNKSEEVQETDPFPHFSDGVHVVGEDIEPGTYRTRVGSSGCYYERMGGFGGTLSEILSNDNTDNPTVVTILPTDKGFKSKRCGNWTQNMSQITNDKTKFGDGMFIVGTDVEPGTYRNTGLSGCYYSRLAGFTGALGDIISNENSDDVAIVTIGATDKGFLSKRCGVWEKIQ